MFLEGLKSFMGYLPSFTLKIDCVLLKVFLGGLHAFWLVSS